MISDRGLPPFERTHLKDDRSDGPTNDLLARCPSPIRDALAAIADRGRGAFGHTTTQRIFDQALPTLEMLYAIGAVHRDIAQIFHALGIGDSRGRPLSIGTVSSAVNRARLKRSHEQPAMARRNDRQSSSLGYTDLVASSTMRLQPQTRTASSKQATGTAAIGKPSVEQLPPDIFTSTPHRLSPPARASPLGSLDLAGTTNFLNFIRMDDDD
jgi:hypothetical protein